jgi:hypothetical protein
LLTIGFTGTFTLSLNETIELHSKHVMFGLRSLKRDDWGSRARGNDGKLGRGRKAHWRVE